MHLLGMPASPFVRKVRVMLLETGLDGRVELSAAPPAEEGAALIDGNPLGKIPTLIPDDSNWTLPDGGIYDSRVICEALDSLHDGPRMFPPGDKERWVVLRLQALADGIMDAAVVRTGERRRPAETQWAGQHQKQKRKIDRGLDVLETQVGTLGDPEGLSHIGAIAVACALSYLDFRYGDEDWRSGRPHLAAWFAAFEKRTSMQNTQLTD
jgi:glutathione S-transferase